MFHYRKVIKKYWEIVICEIDGQWHWDLYFCRGHKFAIYLLAFGKANNHDEAFGAAEKCAFRAIRNYRLVGSNYG